MIAVDGVLWPVLRGLVNDRCRFDKLHQPDYVPIWPAINVEVVGITPEVDVCGTDDGTTDTTTIQIEYITKTKGAAWDLRAQGRAALMTVSPPLVRDGGFQTTDEATRTYRFIDLYSFHPSSEAAS